MQPSESPRDASNAPDAQSQGRSIEYLLKGITAYLTLSILTLPFIGDVWSGEIPVLALFQIPKIKVALWLRSDVVMPLIKILGLSAGSVSPDSIMARPYGLLLSYLIPSVFLFGFLLTGGRFRGINRRWALIVGGVMVVDYLFVMIFGTNPWNHFSIY